MRRLALLVSLCVGCEPAAPSVLEISTPDDTRDVVGPYRVAVLVRGLVDRVEVVWAAGDQEGRVGLRARGEGAWVGGLPGVPAGHTVRLWVRAVGPGGESRLPLEGGFVFRVRGADGACLVDGDCLLDEICDRLAGRCQRPPETCQDEGDCGLDQTCPAPGAACRLLPAPCVDDGACAAGQRCVEGGCVSRPACEGGAECPAGTRCLTPPGRCAAPGVCLRDVDCPAQRPVCRQGQCAVDACGAGCAPGEICAAGVCAPSGPCAGGCPEGARCSPATDRCVECFADGQCGARQHCEIAAGVCGPERRGAPCVPCGAGGACGAGQRCAAELASVCLPACGAGGACPPGFDCAGEWCEPAIFCRGAECESDAQCESGVCLAGVCDPPQICERASDCAADRRCEGGRCVPRAAACLDPFDCEAGAVCLGGRCEPARPSGVCGRCEAAEDCPSPAYCADVDGEGLACASLCGVDGCPAPYACRQVSEALAICVVGGGDRTCPVAPSACGADPQEPNDRPELATAVALDTPLVGRICAEDLDWLRVPDGAARLWVQVEAQAEVVFFEGDRALDGLRLEAGVEVRAQVPARAGLISLRSAAAGEAGYQLRFQGREAPACEDDALEDNDRLAQATVLGSGAAVRGVACAGDEDWFRLRVRDGDEARVTLTPADGGALPWRLLSADGELIDEGRARPGAELIVAPAGVPGPHLQLACERCPTAYTLATQFVGVGACEDDAFEPDDSPEEARALPVPADEAHVVCEGRDDWFRVQKAAGESLVLDFTFRHAEGDVDVEASAERGRWRDESVSGDDDERIVIPRHLPAGAYLIHAYLFPGPRTSTGYRLRVARR